MAVGLARALAYQRIGALGDLEIRERQARDAGDGRHAIGSGDLTHLGVRPELDVPALEGSLRSNIQQQAFGNTTGVELAIDVELTISVLEILDVACKMVGG